jgi:hypothetical protein
MYLTGENTVFCTGNGKDEGDITAALLLDQNLHIPLLEFHFGSQGIRAMGAEVLVLVSLRQNQEETFPDRDRPATARAKELAGFKFAERRRRLRGRIRAS